MSDDLDLRGIDHRYEPDPYFRAALQRRVAAIVAGTDPGSVTAAREPATIDLELTGAKPTPTPKRNHHRRAARVILVAAAGVTFALVASRAGDDSPPADQPSPTVTVTPSMPPQPLPNDFGPIAPGTYYVDEVDGTPTPRIFATIGTGWWNNCDQCEGWGIGKRVPHPDDGMPFDETTFDAYLQRDIGGMSISHPDAVYSDACHWEAGNYPGPVDTVDGLVTALIEQRGWADVTVPSEISIDGYFGKAFQRTAPADMSNCSTRFYATRTSDAMGTNPDFRSWETRGDFNAQYEPGTIEILWVLDLDGTMVIITTGASPEPSAGAPADFAADVLHSIRVARALPYNGGQFPLDPGTYYVDEVNGTPIPRIYATLDSGWYDQDHSQPGWAHIVKGRWPGGTGNVAITNPVAVYSDACHPTDGFYPEPVATVDGFIAALMRQQGGWVDVTAPSDISIDGYVGKAFQRTAPADMSDCTTWDGSPRSSGNAVFPSWDSPDGFNGGYAPGQVETLWVLDIDGKVIVITTELWPKPSATAHADFADDVLDSIRIARP